MEPKKYATVLHLLGNCPIREEIEIVELERVQRDGFVQVLIEYAVEECHEYIRIQDNDTISKVQAYLLIPDGIRGKAPAVVAIHQHHSNWDVGKSEVVGLAGEKEYAYGMDLARRGYVVIAPDLLCFESRKGLYEYDAKDMHFLYERFQMNKYLFRGETLQGKTLRDLSAAVDVLFSLDCVDKYNMGAIGHSLGGQEALWLAWYDHRVKVVASSCGTSTYKEFYRSGYQLNSWAIIPGLETVCDMDEIIAHVTQERKVIMTTGLDDDRHCPLRGMECIETMVADQGVKDNFVLVRFDGEHRFLKEQKRQVYEFFDENLK
ncbi:MAG: prolyl oligopeptidase family serine peptidase [Bacteroidaceae bacterium]|nr:prolyl oligopeptidase family serine peptidase [Bacteroidaceae bacterium]